MTVKKFRVFFAKRLGKLSIRVKLLLIVLLILVLSAVSYGMYYYFRTASYVQQGRSRDFEQLMNQTRTSLDNIIAGVEDTSSVVVLNETLENILRRADMAGYSLAKQLDDYTFLSKYLSAVVNKDVRLVRLYLDNSAIYTRERYRLFQVANALGKRWYERTIDFGGAPVWSSENGEISCVRAIIRYEFYDSQRGFVEAVLNSDAIIRVLDSVLATTAGNVWLLDHDGNLLFSRGEQGGPPDSALLKQFDLIVESQRESKPGEWIPEALTMLRRLTNGWYVVASLPYRAALDEIRGISVEVFYISLASIAAALLLLLLLTSSFNRRVRRIADFMSSVDINSDEYTKELSGDELTVVETNFNQMLRTARQSVRNEKEALRRKKEADFIVLQEQINPHFLYNCLDSINWLAVEYHATEISSMTTLLSRFFRLGLSRGAQIVPLSDELQHAKLYVEIMKKRFDGHLGLEVSEQVDPNAVNTLKYILQPLIENAIMHGISRKENHEGHMRIVCQRLNNTLMLTVWDDGAGIEPERLEALRQALRFDSPDVGFGLYNVNQRIKLHFGEAYGLSIESRVTEGTTVILTLPSDIQAESQENKGV